MSTADTLPDGTASMPIDPAAVPWCLRGSSFQHAMAMSGVSVTAMAAAQHRIARSLYSQRARPHGFIHAGITALTADTAGGFAALSFTPEDAAGWRYEVFAEDAGRRTQVALPTASSAVNTATELLN